MHTLASDAILTRKEWFTIENIDAIDTPALVVYPDRVRDNIRRALLIAGSPDRLRPHIKTSKFAHVATMMMEEGIRQFKCATIAEAEMLAMAGAPDVLLAYQPVGPKVERLLKLINQYPQTRFSCLVDHPVPAKAIGAAASRLALTVPVYIDLNVGMNRTGITPGTEALDLFEACRNQLGLEPVGLHAYDGHINQPGLQERTAACAAAFEPVEDMRRQLAQRGFGRLPLIAGGTPTFLVHAQHPDRQLSPGTFVYWDWSYGTNFPEMPFLPAAMLVCRVVSRPEPRRLTVDLGHKAVAAENDLGRRVRFLNAPDALLVSQSEEHGVLYLPEGHDLNIGDVLYGQPYHICPTVALYEQAAVAENGGVKEHWATGARNRSIGI